jgi:hypothetical protein
MIRVGGVSVILIIKIVFFESPPTAGFQKKTILVFPEPSAQEIPKSFS